jgi:hypothetical protein
MALFFFFLVLGCIQSTPDAIQHCFSDDTTPDECVTMVAVAERNISYCNFLDDDSSSYCYQIFFEQSSPVVVYNHCLTLLDSGACMNYYYRIKNDLTVCNELPSPAKENCQGYFTISKK